MRLAAVDLGGTAIKGARLEDGGPAARAVAPTDARDREAILASLYAVIERLRPFDGIALSSAGDIDPYRGVCTYATDNLPGFTGLALKAALETRYGVRAEVINDGQAALLGEAAAGRLNRPTAMLTLGTGVGGAFYDGEDIVFGEDFTFGRFGHLTLYKGGRPCGCGKKGCIEAYVSGSAVKREAEKLGLAPGELFASDTPAARAAVADFCVCLAAALDTVYAAAPYERMLIGGGVARSARLWLPILEKYTRRKVAAANLGDDAGLSGAAEWFRRRVLWTTI